MKIQCVLLLSTLLVSSSALAAPSKANTFKCQGQKDAINDGSAPSSFVLELTSTSAIYSVGSIRGKADRDTSFEKKNPSSKAVMMTENSPKSPFVSDIGVHLFIEKQMLSGKPGVVGVSTGQPNDGDSGPANLWYTVHYNCRN